MIRDGVSCENTVDRTKVRYVLGGINDTFLTGDTVFDRKKVYS